MAYKAVVSLNLIIERLLNIPKYRNFFLPIPETKIVHEDVLSLKSILECDNFDKKKGSNDLKGNIVMTIPKFRDVLEDHINKCQLLFSESQSIDENLEKVRKEMISFVETMKKILTEYSNAKETSNVPPLVDFVTQIDMEGVYDEDLGELSSKLREETRWWRPLKVIPVEGMAGIGKTTIVKALYNDPVISEYFDTRAFAKVGSNYHQKDILLDLLVCLSPDNNKILGMETSELELKVQINKFLNNRRYLIVLDDVWDTQICHDMKFLPDNKNGSKIILTTRMSKLTWFDFADCNVHKIRFRNEEESWNLFCKKIVCPPGFEKVGKKIVKKCEGLPLGIISIASILSKAEKLDYWENIADNENLFALVLDEGSFMAESLFLSYKHLPPHLKECCLYFGVFPLNHKISVSKLFKLWVGEGLVKLRNSYNPLINSTFETRARSYLESFISHNIILVCQRGSNGRVKTVNANFFWNLLVREAANKKIFHLINSYSSAFSEGIQCQHRLCIHKNALLGFKNVSESIESVPNLRSFLCTGPEHRYPVSICSGLKSIKVLDALTIRLYKFPIEIMELVMLKYLAFMYDGKLHFSISRLKNLVHLIVHQYHLTIINSFPSYMPIEIWNMQELMHLQIMGSDLPHPINGAQLPNLWILLGVSDRSCTKEVLQSIPNLEKLGIRIVLPQDVFETLHIFDHLALLSSLNSFKCIVSNPNPGSGQVLLLSKSVFPSRLTKLTLSGCGFAWEDMSMIGALPNLRELKLQCYAFQGPEWVVDNQEEFPELEYMLLEDTDLVHWKFRHPCFQKLRHLIIRHCYKLRKIITDDRSLTSFWFSHLKSLIIHHCYELDINLEMMVYSRSLVKIEFVACSPDSIASAKKIQQLVEENGMVELKVGVYSSWE